MNVLIEQLNVWGSRALPVAWAMLWQSSLLIGLLLILDAGVGRKLRPGVRYALWLLVLVKLVLPPSLALPTGAAWWLRPAAHSARPQFNAPATVTSGLAAAPMTSQPASVAA